MHTCTYIQQYVHTGRQAYIHTVTYHAETTNDMAYMNRGRHTYIRACWGIQSHSYTTRYRTHPTYTNRNSNMQAFYRARQGQPAIDIHTYCNIQPHTVTHIIHTYRQHMQAGGHSTSHSCIYTYSNTDTHTTYTHAHIL